MEHLFSPNSSGDQRSDADQSQIIGGDADVDHTQIIGGIQSSYWGDISPPGFGTFDCSNMQVRFCSNPDYIMMFIVVVVGQGSFVLPLLILIVEVSLPDVSVLCPPCRKT